MFFLWSNLSFADAFLFGEKFHKLCLDNSIGKKKDRNIITLTGIGDSAVSVLVEGNFIFINILTLVLVAAANFDFVGAVADDFRQDCSNIGFDKIFKTSISAKKFFDGAIFDDSNR